MPQYFILKPNDYLKITKFWIIETTKKSNINHGPFSNQKAVDLYLIILKSKRKS